MQKAAEDLKKEALAKAQEKEKFIIDRVGHLNTEGLGEGNSGVIPALHDSAIFLVFTMIWCGFVFDLLNLYKIK